jgi:hypothetical protein
VPTGGGDAFPAASAPETSLAKRHGFCLYSVPSTFDARVSMRRFMAPFLIGLPLAPLFMVLHEGAHYLAAAGLGFHPELHFARVSYHLAATPAPWVEASISAAGPAVQALLAGGALLWLHRRRRRRRRDPATSLDWLVTWLALNAGRWPAGGMARTFIGTALVDEVIVATALGLPPWLVLSLLALLALGALVATVRLHPPGWRVLPFGCAILGGVLGGNLWLRLIGPRLLP